MVQQIVVFTPNTQLSVIEAFNHITSLLPQEIVNYLESSYFDGKRTSAITEDNNTFTLVTDWDDVAVQQYKILMADVSASVAEQLSDDGWVIEFAPLTVDL